MNFFFLVTVRWWLFHSISVQNYSNRLREERKEILIVVFVLHWRGLWDFGDYILNCIFIFLICKFLNFRTTPLKSYFLEPCVMICTVEYTAISKAVSISTYIRRLQIILWCMKYRLTKQFEILNTSLQIIFSRIYTHLHILDKDQIFASFHLLGGYYGLKFGIPLSNRIRFGEPVFRYTHEEAIKLRKYENTVN